MTGALDGIKVLEFSQLIAGPVTGLNLADLGAEVVKVEPPTGDTARAIGAFLPHESKLFHALNRGKRSVVIDAHTPPGRDLIHRLIPSFDVFLINARSGAALRLGMDYGALRPLRPDLIYLENTGFGEAGPSAGRPATDLLAQAYSGLIVGFGKVDDAGAPTTITNTAPLDYATGVSGALAVCAALFHRERTGEGQRVATNLLSTAMAFQSPSVAELPVVDAIVREPMLAKVLAVRDAGGTYPEMLQARQEASHQLGAATFLYYGGYNTKDGAIVLGSATAATRAQIRTALAIDDDPTADPEFNALDPANDPIVDAMKARIRALFLSRTTADWMTALDAADAPAAAVNLPEHVSRDPQVEAAGLMIDLEHPLTGPERMVGSQISMSATTTGAARPSPALDADTDAFLAEAGLPPDEIAALRASGVTGIPAG